MVLLRYCILAFLLAASGIAAAQTTGLIVEPATGASAAILDPNGDGYVSATTAGFAGDDQLLANNELGWRTLIPAGSEPNSDVRNGPDCGFTDFVESTSGGIDPVFHLSTGTEWLFRFRMASIAPNAKSYSILVDIDNLIGPTDDCYIAGVNPGFELEIVLSTKFGVRIYDHRLACGSNLIASYGVDRIQKSIAASTVCSSINYFIEYYVDWSDLTTQFGIDENTAMRYAIVDNMAADKSTICNPSSASDIGGVDDTGCGNLESCFTDIIEEQPTCSPSATATCVYSDCPIISGLPLATGATSVSGTSTEADGTTIRLYVNGGLAGSTTVTGGGWTVSPITALAADDAVTATAQATGEVESGTNCNNVQVAGASCSDPVTSVNVCNANKAFTGVTTEVGATITLYDANGVVQNPTSGTVWNAGSSTITSTSVPSALSPTTDNFLWRCVGSGSTTSCTAGGGPCLTDGNYYLTTQNTGECESTPFWFCIGLSGSTATPTISTTITTATTSVTGTVPAPENIAGVLVILFNNGFEVGRTTTTAGGAWTINSLSFAACDVVTAQAIKTAATAKCPSVLSASQTVSGGTTATPTVSGSYCGTTATVSGTSTEDGATIEVFDDGVSAGTTTVSGGLWELTGLTIAQGSVITARATNSGGCKSVSALSSGVTVGTQNTNATTIDQNPLIESDVTITGTGTPSDVISLYIDGWPLYLDFAETSAASTTVTGGGTWSITLTDNTLYAGASVTVRSSNGSTCESTDQDPTPVNCQSPTLTLVVNPDNSVICTGTAVTNVEVESSQSGVIYQLLDGGTPTGSSKLGNGGTITLSTAPLSSNTTISVRAIKSPYDGSCTVTLNETVAVTVVSPPTIAYVTQSNPTTCGGTDGSITISGLQNNQSYTVNYTDDGSPTSGAFTSNGSGQIIITGLNAGAYTNISTTGLGCSSTNTLAGPFTLTQPNNTAGAGSSSPTLCVSTALTNITHTTTGATGISNDG
ncbi:MAG: hypothetical protein EP338_11205, partial [Bacteroidetes bacterium]